jgi:hypothetical protein
VIKKQIRAICCTAALVLMMALPVQAQQKPAASGEMSEVEEFTFFVLGNTVYTLFHELGHALIHQFDIPVLGREEDAVDGLAAVLMIPDEADPIADELILAAADGYALAHDQGQSNDQAYWGAHSFDMQRFAATHCLIYGSDPKGFADLAKDLEMTAEEKQRCPEKYKKTVSSWDKHLNRHARGKGELGGRITVRFEKPGKNTDPDLVALLKESKMMGEAVTAIAETIRLKRDIPVTFKSCNAANAFYHPESSSVTMCYELVSFFGELIVKDIEARKKTKK